MANAERDEHDLTIEGQTYTLKLTTNAMCEVETAMSTTLRQVSFADVLMASNKHNVSAMRAIFWASLRDKHPEVTLAKAGELMDKVGGSKTFAEKFAAMVFAAVPADSDAKALGLKTGKDARPQKAQRRRGGTGKSLNDKPVTLA